MAGILSKSAVFSPICSHHNNKIGVYPVTCSVPIKNQGKLLGVSSLKSDFGGLRLTVVQDDNNSMWAYKRGKSQSIHAKMGLIIGKAQKWWDKGLQPNMKEIDSAEELVDSLLKAGDNLVVVDFFSPGCGGCKALHPKICQLAQMNPDVQFIQVNYEEHKSMCYSLGVHVLPFFRFYRGSEGRVCSFSCTNVTVSLYIRNLCPIKKFKDALARYSPARCSLGPAKGLEEKELLALAANRDLSFIYTPKPVEPEPTPLHQEVLAETEAEAAGEAPSPSKTNHPYPSTTVKSSRDSEDRTLVAAGR